MIVFSCPACQKKLSVQADVAGKKAKCPHCGGIVIVPGAVAASQSLDARNSRSSETPASVSVSEGYPPARPAPDGDPTKEAIPPPDTRTGAYEKNHQARAGLDAELWSFLAPAEKPDEIGRLGPYRVLKVLGAGGMGVVFHAEDIHLGRFVALKAKRPSLASSSSGRDRFKLEATAAATIKHPRIVTIHHVGEERGTVFLAMEFLEGESLETRLRRKPRLTPPEILRIGRQIAEGLAAAHAKGLIHRDIKPGNIWLETRGEGRAAREETTEKGRGARDEIQPSDPSLAPRPSSLAPHVKILDFGLVLAQGDLTHLTQSGVVVGTPAYMSPEQASGQPVDPRSDLFSLGCVLYRMCTGKMPFKGADTFAVLSALALETPPAPHSLSAEVPIGLSDLVMRLLAKKPAQRPKSALEVVKVIQELSQPAPSLAPAAPPAGGTSWRPLAWFAGAGVLVLALVLGAALGLWFFFADRFGTPIDPPELTANENDRKPVPADLPKKTQEPEKKTAIAKKPTGEPADLRLVDTLVGHKNNVKWVAFAPDSKTLASSAEDHTVWIWDLTAKNRMPRVLGGHIHQQVICTDFRKDGLMLASAANDVVSLWRPNDVPPLPLLAACSVGLAASPLADRRLLAASALRPGHGKFAELRGRGISGVAFSPDGKRLAGSSSDQTVYLWNPNAPAEKPLILRATRGTSLSGVAWGGDNQTVFASGADGRVFRWKLEQPQAPFSFQAHTSRIEMVACTVDGQFVATAGYDGSAKVWTKDGKLLGDLRTWREVLCVAFSPDGKLVATASSDHLVRLWDRADRRLLAIGKGHTNWVFAVAFAPNGLTLASGSHDDTVKLWDVADFVTR